MIERLGIRSIELLTNNPEKQRGLEELGIQVDARIPVLVPANAFSAGYLATKRTRMQHYIPLETAPRTTPHQKPDLILVSNGDK